MTEAFTEQLIVQLPMGLSNDDLGIRHRLEEDLDAALFTGGVGLVDGGDIGSGTMNVFAIVRPEQWDQAQATVLTILGDMGLSEVALVARRVAADDYTEPRIVWPERSDREFRY